MYPQSFNNETVSGDRNYIKEVRSNLQNMEDIDKWISEYQEITNTKWNVRRSLPNGEKIVAS
jgi:hypothetical protein